MPDRWVQYEVSSAPADDKWAKYAVTDTPAAPKPTPVVTGTLSANKHPEGWFQQAQEDLQQGGNRTILGRTLGHLQGRGDQGYTGLQSGVSKGAAEIAGSPELGLLHVAQGNANAYRAAAENTSYLPRLLHAYYEGEKAPKTPDGMQQAKEGPLRIAQGVLEASQLPSMFAGPEAIEKTAGGIPSAKHAGQVLNEIEQAAAHVPVKLNTSGQALSRAMELDATGHNAPPSIKKLIARYTDPNKADMTYKEARDFMSKISQLTAQERKTASPQMKAEIAKVAAGLKQDIAAAADEVGESARYYASVKEYARAKRMVAVGKAIRKTLAKYGWHAAGGLGIGAGGTLGYELAKGALRPANETMPGGSPDLSALPAPVQRALEGAKITQGKPTSTYGGKQDIATVEEGDPKNITVRDPSRMQPQVLAHEATHLWQSNLSPSAKSGMAKDDPAKPYLTPQDMYSLPAMRRKGVTMGHLSSEQQASVVQAYVQYPGMRKMLQPWIDDMSKMSKSNILPTGPEDKSINTTPRAPEAPAWAYQPVQ